MPARLPRAPATVPIPNALGRAKLGSSGTTDCLASLALALAWLLDDELVATYRHLLLILTAVGAGRRWVASRQMPQEMREEASGDATERIIVLALLTYTFYSMTDAMAMADGGQL